jgi:hypothetical protein
LLLHNEIESVKDNTFGRRTGIGIAVVPNLISGGGINPTGANWIGYHLHKLMAQKYNFAIHGERMIADRSGHPFRTSG